ncbi:unnamed protein product [Allacma fusca]|uniref:Secreted protein n=1 Tax=Allacma fusca TaxID=39272 RepID=A0A8J2KNZ8_9HEXA|nr:unnamed protein product [Allacma fusca]
MVAGPPILALFFFSFLIEISVANTETARDFNLSPSSSQSGKGCPVGNTLKQGVGTGRCDQNTPVSDVPVFKLIKRAVKESFTGKHFLSLTPRGGKCPSDRALNGACVTGRLIEDR